MTDAKVQKQIPKYLINHGPEFDHLETDSPPTKTDFAISLKFRAYKTADEDPQQTRIFTLLTYKVKAS